MGANAMTSSSMVSEQILFFAPSSKRTGNRCLYISTSTGFIRFKSEQFVCKLKERFVFVS